MKTSIIGFALSIVPISLYADTVAVGLLERRVPALAEKIEFESLPASSPRDTFSLSHREGKVVVSGDSTNSRAAGLHWYLKRHCNMHFSWSGDQLQIPDPLPLPDEGPRTSPWRWRSAHNHCVFSYSMAFWDWSRWEREIDYLALNGINQAFLLTGHEKVWQNTLRRLGFSDEQIATWLPSTSHIAWWHFDNLQGEGGPISQHEIDNEAALARKVADRMREFGIEPIACAFYGMVPDFFASKFPDAKILPQGNWVGGYTRPPMLDPGDAVFAKAAEIYYEELEAILGPVRHFGGDPFHEGGKPGDLDLPAAFKSVQDAMRKDNPEAIWVMFGWQSNPRQAALERLSPQHVLVQQTSMNPGTAIPVSGSYRDLGGEIPWTWQLIDNFGGNHGLYGNFDTLSSMPSRFLGGDMPGKFTGIGHSPEAIETNSMQASLFYDMLWRDKDIPVSEWLDGEILARYGKSNKYARAAWDLLARSSYRCPIAQEGIADLIFATRPRPDAQRARTWAGNAAYASELDLVEAWRLMLSAGPELAENVNYRHDLIDVSRHVMNYHSLRIHREMMEAFGSRNRNAFDAASAELMQLFDELDALLGSGENWLLGTWLEAAKAKANDPADKARIERNARNLITLWSGKSDSLDDYSSRSWAGLVGAHYKARWARYIEDLRAGWEKSGVPAYTGLDLELAFLDDKTAFSTEPEGDTHSLSQAIYQRISLAVRKVAPMRWSVPQQEKGASVLRYDVTERLGNSDQQRQITISRQFGRSDVNLTKVKLTRQDGQILAESSPDLVIGSSTSRINLGEIPQVPSGNRVMLEIHLESPGGGVIANGPLVLGDVYPVKRESYIGKYSYQSGSVTYVRELHANGSVSLAVDGKNYSGWRDYKWKFSNGEAMLYDAKGNCFERHVLTDAVTMEFQQEPHYGPAIRME